MLKPVTVKSYESNSVVISGGVDEGARVVVLGVLLLTSKGGTAVAGGAFVKLAATLQSVQVLPLSGLPLLLSVDRLMAIAISLTNIVGNTVAVLAIAAWEHALDRTRFDAFVRSGATIGDEPAAANHPRDRQAV